MSSPPPPNKNIWPGKYLGPVFDVESGDGAGNPAHEVVGSQGQGPEPITSVLIGLIGFKVLGY